MMSIRETAISALHDTLHAAVAGMDPAPTVLRNETVPQRLPPGGVLVLQDGETEEATAMLSPLAYAIRHRAELEITVGGADEAERIARLDALLGVVAAAIIANRTLGGAVEWSEPGPPLIEPVPVEGAAALKAALLPITLWFTAPDTPLG
jgi:hypothetical protein